MTHPGKFAWWRAANRSALQPQWHAFPMSTFSAGLSGKALCGVTVEPKGARFGHTPLAGRGCRECEKMAEAAK